MTRRICLFAVAIAALLSVKTASATPIFTWTVTPSVSTIYTGSTVHEVLTGTITNTGTDSLTGIAGLGAIANSTLSPVNGLLGPDGTMASLESEFDAVLASPLATGQTVSFLLGSFDITGSSIGTYALLSSEYLDLFSGSTVSGHIAAVSSPSLNVTATPEPSSLILLGTGALGLLALTQRKFLRGLSLKNSATIA